MATVTIAASASLSGAIELNPLDALVGIVMPAAWTAADLTFQGSVDNSTFNDVYDKDETELTVQAAASRYIILEPAQFSGIRYLKVRSGTSASAVAQAAARTITLVARPV